MAQVSPLVAALTRELANYPSLDARAVLAIAQHEGLSGGVGDQGTSFGPFQLHKGGALPANIPLASANQWAWSPAGLNYALSRIQTVAGGLHGLPAITAISRRFERPADPAAEIADAASHYGSSSANAGAAAVPSRVPASAPGAARAIPDPAGRLLASLIGQTNNDLGLGGSNLIGELVGAAAGNPKPRPPAPSPGLGGLTPPPTYPGGLPGAFGGGKKTGVAELLNEGTGGPTHSTGPHIHAAFTDPKLELAAIQWAQQHGLNVGENPYVGSLSPGVHAPHSYHNVDFPGVYNGRKLGEAIDVSGPAQQAFYRWLSRRS